MLYPLGLFVHKLISESVFSAKMQILILVVAMLRLSCALMWHPQSGDPPLPEGLLGSQANSNTPQLRRRPSPGSYSTEAVGMLQILS